MSIPSFLYARICVLVVDVAVVADVSVAVVVVADVSVVIRHVPQRIGHTFWYSTLVTLLVHLATSSQAMSSTLPLVSGGVVVVLVVTVMTTLQVAQSTGHSCWTASFVTPLVHIDCGYSLQMNGSAIPLHVDGHELQRTGHAFENLLANKCVLEALFLGQCATLDRVGSTIANR
jgi:hypothetical protein